ncbi:CvpA family protein [Streptococcus uberis]|uniref:CvpA family protein n=1 Tax=Streptococcus uberis TaxID=1349 RepID=UPI0038912E68
MISLAILMILLWQFYIGYHRGIILQTFYVFGAILSFWLAKNYYQTLSSKISLWIPYSNPAEGVQTAFFKEVNIFDLNKVFYAGITFFGLFAIFYLLVRLIGIFLHFMPLNHFDDFPYHIVSGFLAVSVALMFLSMITSILATVPIPTIQDQLSSHFILKALVDHCPPMTTLIRDLWIHKII